MRFPKFCAVGQREYEIVQVPRETIKCKGLFDEKNRRIYISRHLSKRIKWITLIHEILHAIIYESGLEKDLYKIKSDEPIVERIDTLLHDVLRKNRWLK